MDYFCCIFFVFVFISLQTQNTFYTNQLEWEKREALSGKINPSLYSQEYRQQILDNYVVILENAEEDLKHAVESGTELDVWDK